MTKYIPEGISFDEAEHILRCAGFDVCERPDADVPGEQSDRYDVIATTLLDKSFIGRTDLILAMRPKSPVDYSTVKEIRAAIIVTYL
jgi:hypothetical protein